MTIEGDEPICEYCLERIHDIEKKIAEMKREIEYWELIICRRLSNEYQQITAPTVHTARLGMNENDD